MTLKFKVPLVTVACIIVSNLLFSIILYSYSFQNVIENMREDRMTKVVTQLESLLEDYKMRVASLADLLAERNTVKEMVAKSDRKALYELLESDYKVQNQRYDISVLEIIQEPTTILLRMHNPEKFGDDVAYRNMVIATRARNKAFRGIEIGRSGVDIRAMSPLDYQGKQVGIVEVGIDFDGIIQTIKSNTNFEVAIFVFQDLLTEKAKDLSPPESDELVGGMRVLFKTNWNKIRPYLTAEMLRNLQTTVTLSRKIDGKSIGVVLTPLQDFSGTTIGAFVAVREFEKIQASENKFWLDLVSLTAIQIILLTGIVLIIFRGWILRPVTALNLCLEKLQKKPKKTAETTIHELGLRSDEVGEMARSLEKLIKNQPVDNDATETKDETGL